MSFQREDPNPLRPYAVSPSVGRPSVAASQGASQSQANASVRAAPKPSSQYGRDILSDLDYGDYLHNASPSAIEMLKGVVDQGVWKYTSIFLAQPFEVAKTLLQVQDAEAIGRTAKGKGKSKQKRMDIGRRGSRESYNAQNTISDDSDNDAQSYFDTSAPLRTSGTRSRRRYSSSPSPPLSGSPTTPSHQDNLAALHKHNLTSSSSVTAAISSLWTHEGAWGIWKGTNSTFVYSVLYGTITSFVRSLLFAILGLPDPGTASSSPPAIGPAGIAAIDITSSPAPLLSLLAAVGASGLAGALLAPFDIARTKLLVTPSTHPPRSIVPTLKSLKSWILPASIAPATILHSALPTFMAVSTPLFFRSNLGIDPILTPTTYSFATFCSQVVELGLRLPIETTLRRGQVALVSSSLSSTSRARQAEPLQTVVNVGAHKGLMGTMYHIAFEEGTRQQKSTTIASRQHTHTERKGQGFEGLFRGWRIGIWGLVGVWSASAIGSGKGGEF